MAETTEPVIVSAYSDTDTTVIENPFPPHVNYNFEGWSQLSSSTDITIVPGQRLTFQKDTDLYGIWKQTDVKLFRVTYSTPLNGTLFIKIDGKNISSGSYVNEGTAVRVTAVQDSGYRLKSLRANGIDITNGEEFTVVEDVQFEAAFDSEYVISWEAPVGGTLRVTYKSGDEWVQISSGERLLAGTIISPVAQAIKGYIFESLTINGEEVESGVEHTLTGNVVLDAVFSETTVEQHKISIIPSFGGQVYLTDQYSDEIEDGAFVEHGQIISAYAVPNTGYSFEKLTINGTETTNPAEFELTCDTSVTASFKVHKHTVNIVQPENGIVAVRYGADDVESGTLWDYGTTFTYSTSFSSGYSGWTTINKEGKGQSGQYTMSGDTQFGGYTYEKAAYRYVVMASTTGNPKYYSRNQVSGIIQFTGYDHNIRSPFASHFSSADQLAMADDQTSGVISVGDFAFYGCQNLQTVSFPACESVGEQAFYGCENLKLASIPECISIRQHGFYNNTRLEIIAAPKATDIGTYAFHACHFLKNANFPVCSQVGDFAFGNCMQLQLINMPAVSVASANTFTLVGSCIKSLAIGISGQFNTSGYGFVFPMQNAAYVSLPNVASIASSAFSHASSLHTLYAPNCSIVGANALAGCTGIQQLTLGISGTIGKSLAGLTISSCQSLSYVSFARAVSLGADVFHSCSSLTSVYFPVCKAIAGVWDEQEVHGAFAYCKFSHIALPECSDIGAMTFYKCQDLVQVSLPSCITLRSQAFMNCTSLTSVSLPLCTAIQGGGSDENPAEVTAGAFEGCLRLSQVFAPVCSAIGNGAFACGKIQESIRDSNPITNLTIGFTGTFTRQTIYNWFRCSCSSSNNSGLNLKYLSASRATAIGSSAFQGCTTLKEVSFNACRSIYQSAFYGCSMLTSVYLMSTQVVTLQSADAFYGCDIDYQVYVPSSLYTAYIANSAWKPLQMHIVSAG